MRIAALLASAGLCLGVGLVLAWLLGITLFFPQGALARIIVDRQNLIRAHIDYLMMAQFLCIFGLLLRQYGVDPPLWVVGSACYGAFSNPLGFLRRAVSFKPLEHGLPASQGTPYFPLQAAVSFCLATIGFMGALALVIKAAAQ